jgi:hypothetical protein
MVVIPEVPPSVRESDRFFSSRGTSHVLSCMQMIP